jgi:hypothetical protein
MVFGISKGRSQKKMRSFLINKNLCLYYWLRKRVGKKEALWISTHIEKAMFLLGREVMPFNIV